MMCISQNISMSLSSAWFARPLHVVAGMCRDTGEAMVIDVLHGFLIVREQGMGDEADAWRVDTCCHLHQAMHMASVLGNGTRGAGDGDRDRGRAGEGEGEGEGSEGGENTGGDSKHESEHRVTPPEMYIYDIDRCEL